MVWGHSPGHRRAEAQGGWRRAALLQPTRPLLLAPGPQVPPAPRPGMGTQTQYGWKARQLMAPTRWPMKPS